MKKILLIGLILTIIIFLTLIPGRMPIERFYIDVTISKLESIADEQKTGWSSEVLEPIKKLKNETIDPDYLLQRMLESNNGTIAAEGMIYTYEKIKKQDEFIHILEPFKSDKRWNYWLTSNSELYKITLIANKIRNGEQLTQKEQSAAKEWKNILKETYKIDYR